jgi:hypothetical protein
VNAAWMRRVSTLVSFLPTSLVNITKESIDV